MKKDDLEKHCKEQIEKIKKLEDIDDLKNILCMGCKLLDSVDFLSIDKFTMGKINEEITVEELQKVNIMLQEHLLYLCKLGEKLSNMAEPIINRYDSKCKSDKDNFFDELHNLIDEIRKDMEN